MRAPVLSVNVFRHDPGLLDGLRDDAARGVLAVGEAEVVSHERGIVELASPRAGFGLLVLDGFVSREATVIDRTSVELMGGGDVLRPWQDERAEAPVPVASQYRAVTAVRLAVLDAGFARRVAPWPAVADAICTRLVERGRWLALQLALARLRRVEDRVLILLWHLADRWGRVERDGTVVCPVPVTHELLAGMTASQRPTVSTALGQLTAEGRILKHGEGWALRGEPPTASELEGKTLADAFRLRPED